ncbi:MAG: tetratricopeptide repeat protein [Bryobacterales bacterium]|nr:tetratricopeptide repeat protein [Bryobacterales bacterium]
MTRRILLACGVSTLLVPAGMLAQSAIDAAKKKSKEGKHDEAIAALEAELKKNPKDAKVKTALAEAHLANGEFFMFNDQMPPFRKYPTALRQFRKTVEYDPTNKKAKEHIATIEGIYKSMGREVPK